MRKTIHKANTRGVADFGWLHSKHTFSFSSYYNPNRMLLNKVTDVYLCNGDRHWQYVTHWEGTNLWEFGCGAGADIHAGGWSQADVRPEHRFLRVKGGFLYGKTERKDHQVTLTFQHCDVNGNVVHEESFVRDAI